ncbi:uncharacterized protein LOC110720509 [Chenopodium quinoa]|uniref:uncharacterized protein LOC110720509 n=1 Tax=Chenopodium quinoa TaxID=63459 RepID=UPI000B7879E4|nr:uncharacterized protein LOC110720509 [Chenopodium quinoa]
MASQNVVLLCRWGGEILFDGPRVEYSGGNMEPLTLEPNMTMNDLMNEVHSSIGSDPMTVDVHIKMRFETGNGVQVLPVSTNKHVTALRNVVAMKGVPTEIYVETVPICTQQSTRPEQQSTRISGYNTEPFQVPSHDIPSTEYGMGSFSRMLHDDPGIIAAMTDPNVGFTEPRAYHRFCVRHIASNLYRQLCRASHVGANEIGGPLIVLQFWAWEHIHVGRPGRPAIHRRGEQDQDDQYQAYDAPPLPTPDEAYGCRWVVPRLTHAHAARGLPYYRDALDRLTEDQVTWDPYVPDLVDAMPPHLLDHQAEWRARVPLICFEVVESHLPDRVMRQFGLRQTIPQGCDTSVQLHGIDRRGKGETSWALEHWRFLQLWEQRLEFIVGGDLMQGAMDPDDPYMVWYRRITRRFINPSYAPPSTHYHPAYDIISGYAADMVAMVDALSVSLECGPTRAQVEQVRDMGVATLRRYGHAHLAHRRDGHDGNSQFDLGQSSGGCDPTSPRHAEDYNIHSTAPSGTQEDPSSSQLTPPPPRDPFTTVTHYRRRRVRRRADTQEAGPLPRINESG